MVFAAEKESEARGGIEGLNAEASFSRNISKCVMND